jgi:hypothetical protein
MKSAGGGGWTAVAIGLAMVAPLGLGIGQSRPGGVESSYPFPDKLASNGTDDLPRQTQRQTLETELELLRDLGIHADEVFTVPGAPSLRIVRFCEEAEPLSGGSS